MTSTTTTITTTKREVQLLPPARRYLKKLKDKKLRKLFDDAIEVIREDPTAGQVKTGDLAGVYVYGVHYNKTEYRVAYMVDYKPDGSLSIIVMIGVHENFYEELKRYVKTLQ